MLTVDSNETINDLNLFEQQSTEIFLGDFNGGHIGSPAIADKEQQMSHKYLPVTHKSWRKSLNLSLKSMRRNNIPAARLPH